MIFVSFCLKLNFHKFSARLLSLTTSSELMSASKTIVTVGLTLNPDVNHHLLETHHCIHYQL